MQTRVIDRDEVAGFLKGLLADYRVIAPVEAEPGYYRFEEIEDAREAVLDYVTTVLPPKAALFPQREVLFTYTTDDGEGRPAFKAALDDTPQVLVGVHPCDLAGIRMLDWAFEKDHRDEHYLTRRKATVLVGVDCQPDEHCFCTEVGTGAPREGFDLFLTPVDDGYLISVGTERGGNLLMTYATTREARPADLSAAGKWQKDKAAKVSRHFDTDVYNLPLTFQHGASSSAWEETADACLNCGSCNLVCPTCFCFDVEDVVNVDGKGGVRQRSWDGCQLSGFASVAGGHDFRARALQRLRHRFYRKYQYLMTTYGSPFCTGCGRCGRSCPVDINVVDTVNALIASARKEAKADVTV